MNWKSWPYWVKALLMGLITGILVDAYLLYNQEDFFFNQPTCLSIGTECDGYVSLPVVYVALTSLLIVFSFIGALTGYLYGKFKNRKQLNSGFPLSRE